MKKRVLVMVSPASEARMRGIARCARLHGWHLMVHDRLGARPLAWEGDGVVATVRGDARTLALLRSFAARGIPVVDLAASRPDLPLPRVASDHEAIGRLAAEHFLERNFRAAVWFSTGWSAVHEARWRGFSRAILAKRWVMQRELAANVRGDWDAFASWLAKKFAASPRPLAALAYDEADAASLLDAAESAGLSVPEELAILAIGNDPLLCESQSVPLSSIDQDLERAAFEGATLLARLMDGASPPKAPTLVPPAGVVLRRSTDIVATADPLVRRALDWIVANLGRDIGAEQVAAATGEGRRKLDRHFAADLGRSVGSEILRRRLARAKVLLRNTGMTASAIAAECGFCSPSHFSNAFSAATGLSPARWRAAGRA